MEKGFNHKKYRDSLAEDLKTISDHKERREVYESATQDLRYSMAEGEHRKDNEYRYENSPAQLVALNKELYEGGSVARVDMSFEKSISYVEIDADILQTFASAKEAFLRSNVESYRTPVSSCSELWNEVPWIPPEVSFEAITLVYRNEQVRSSLDSIIADAQRVGFRPPTFPEMMALGIQYPDFTEGEEAKIFAGLTPYTSDKVDESFVPVLGKFNGTLGDRRKRRSIEAMALTDFLVPDEKKLFIFVRESL